MAAEDTAGEGVGETVPASSTVDATRSATIDHAQLARAMATTPPPGHVDLSQSTVGRYRVVRQLGAGGMGVVYEAIDPSLDRRVALKLMRRRGRAARASDQARFTREARALAKLQHPNVVSVYDAGDSEHGAFVVMSLVDGETLAQRIARGPLPWPEAVAIASAAARGLAAAHAVGIMHRDVKPSNILLEKDGTVRVGDFGLARSLDEGDAGAEGGLPVTAAGAAIGTPRYMAFEQHQGRPATAKSDQYSLCVTLYEALYGAHPFAPASRDMTLALAAMRADAVRPPPPAMRVPKRIERAIRRGLRCDPAARFPSMEALIAALAPRRRPAVRWAALGVLAAAAIALLVVGSRREEQDRRRAPATPPMQLVRLTRVGDVVRPEVSPDGRSLAYLRGRDLYLRDLDGDAADRRIATEVGHYVWSPTSDRLVVQTFRSSETHVVSRTGERLQPLPPGRWSWSHDGELFSAFMSDKQITFRDLRSGATRSCLVPGEYEWLQHVEMSVRGGRMLAVTTRKGDLMTIWTFRPDCSELRALLVERNAVATYDRPPRWSADGDAVIVPMKGSSGGVALELVPLAWPWMRRVIVDGIDLRWFSIGPDGSLFYDQDDGGAQLWRVSPEGVSTRLRDETRPRYGLALAPDGTAVSFIERTDRGHALVLQPLDGRPASVLLTHEHRDAELRRAVLSPDQQEIATITYDGTAVVARVIARASASPRSPSRLELPDIDDVFWSEGLLFLHPLDHRDFVVIDRHGERSRLVDRPRAGWLFNPTVSPDGRTVAVHWNRRPRDGIWTIGLGDRREELVAPGLTPVGWSPDGNWIFAVAQDLTTPVRVPAHGGAVQPWMDITSAGPVGELVATPDGGAVILVPKMSSDLFMVPGVAR